MLSFSDSVAPWYTVYYFLLSYHDQSIFILKIRNILTTNHLSSYLRKKKAEAFLLLPKTLFIHSLISAWRFIICQYPKRAEGSMWFLTQKTAPHDANTQTSAVIVNSGISKTWKGATSLSWVVPRVPRARRVPENRFLNSCR